MISSIRERKLCKICNESSFIYDVVDFNKFCDGNNPYQYGFSMIPIYYYKCDNCGFIFTDFTDNYEDKDFKEKIYNDDYVLVDQDYESVRPIEDAKQLNEYLLKNKNDIIGIDFGGGKGVLASEMNRYGYVYHTYDKFGESSIDKEMIGKYNFCSAFEVFEHLPDPKNSLNLIKEMMTRSNPRILIGTQLSDGNVNDHDRLSWWYAAPRNGHISLFSRAAISILASNAGFRLVESTGHLHLLAK